MMTSTVLILPAALREAGNAIAIALGHDEEPGNTYSVPISATAAEPASHYGCHTWATETFLGVMAEANQGHYPEGVEPQQASTVMSMLISSFKAEGEQAPPDHFEEVLAAHGLQRVRGGL